MPAYIVPCYYNSYSSSSCHIQIDCPWLFILSFYFFIDALSESATTYWCDKNINKKCTVYIFILQNVGKSSSSAISRPSLASSWKSKVTIDDLFDLYFQIYASNITESERPIDVASDVRTVRSKPL